MASGSMAFFRDRRYICTSDSTWVLSGPAKISFFTCTTVWQVYSRRSISSWIHFFSTIFNNPACFTGLNCHLSSSLKLTGKLQPPFWHSLWTRAPIMITIDSLMSVLPTFPFEISCKGKLSLKVSMHSMHLKNSHLLTGKRCLWRNQYYVLWFVCSNEFKKQNFMRCLSHFAKFI